MNSDIFFDAAAVHGDTELVASLRSDAIAAVVDAKDFLHAMSLRAGQFETPLNWIGRFKLVDGRVDLKKGGLMPIFSAARVLALRHTIVAHSTPARLERAMALEVEGAHAVPDLLEAHRILLGAILRQQLRDIEVGIKLSNSVDPSQLDGHETQELYWALGQIGSVRDLLKIPALG